MSAVQSRLGKYLRPHLASLTPYAAVETVETLAERYGLDPNAISKLDANENPYGPSPLVFERIAALHSLHHYPDPLAGDLRRRLARYAGVDTEQVLVGAGADELLDIIVRVFVDPGDETIDSSPTFSMYKAFTTQHAGRTIDVPRKDDWSLDVDGILAAIGPRTRVIWACTPNNPTGNTVDEADLVRLLETGLPVVADEAYYEFSGRTYVHLLAKYPNLIVLRTFSKLAALAGMRIGYMLASPELIQETLKIKQPYNVTVVSQEAALASLDDLDRLQEHIRAIVSERERIAALLAQQDGFSVWPSEANFILCDIDGDAIALQEQLSHRGVFVRYFEKPRISNSLRISAGRPEDTDRLMTALAEINAERGAR